MKRVPPSVRMKEDVEALLQGRGAEPELVEPPMDGFVRGTARYLLQVAIEAEATAFLGRGHYRRGDRIHVGWRNGYEPKAVQTEAGLLKFAVPQLRGTDAAFRPQLPERLATRTPDLEALVRGMYVRGLSTQDIGALYGETFGETRLSKSTVSRITQQLARDFDTWRRRDLSELAVVYLCRHPNKIACSCRSHSRGSRWPRRDRAIRLRSLFGLVRNAEVGSSSLLPVSGNVHEKPS